MQKLREELKNTPVDASQVHCSVSNVLNKVEKLSVHNKVLTRNNSEVNLHQHKGGSDLRVLNIVYVLNQRNQPLMPTTQAKARHLIKSKKASVIKRFPFTIQLIKATGETTQPITLGVDTGYKYVGLSAITSTNELFSATVELRTNIVMLLSEKKMYRVGRRKKIWYRKQRFSNRAIPKGWLAPSIMHKMDSHVRLVDKISKFLPITKVVIEVANFDIQKINNPDITGEQYQKGNLYNYQNNKDYLITREHNKCQLCGKEYVDNNNGWHKHHIIPKSKGGTDTVNNLALLHKKCHEKLHKHKLYDLLKANKQFKAETFMSIMRYKIIEKLKQNYDTSMTFGYITKSKRIELQLCKSHSNDAFVIAGGNNHISQCYTNNIKQKRKNNRRTQLNRKGFKPSIKRCRYKIQPYDLLMINGQEYISKGVQSLGRYVCCINKLNHKIAFNIKLVDRIYHVNCFVWNQIKTKWTK